MQDPTPRQELHQPSNGARKGTKKDGGGGKGTWGKLGDEYDGAPSSLDENDPNYDPETDGGKPVFLASEA